MIGIDLSPKLIWKFKYDFSEDYIKELLDDVIFDDIPLEVGKAGSSVNRKDTQPHLKSCNVDFLQWMTDKAISVFKEWEYPTRLPFFIHSSWNNLHARSGETIEHNHALSNMVVSCYLKCPSNSGSIMFRDPIHDYRCMEPVVTGSDPWREVQVETGDVLFFPGWLYHKTQASNTDQPRIVSTYNIKSKLELLNR